MSEEEYKVAEIEFLRAHLQQRAVICYSMIAAGVVCLAAGIVMLVVGLRGDQVIWFQQGNFKITAGGFGAVTMLASVAWGFVAYRSRPEIEYDSPQLRFSLRVIPPERHKRFSAKRDLERAIKEKDEY
jgi:hypothetical protein